ncbi:MAG: (d)CMP kinase [Oscillospiraceae bacterium]|nr:(d)CMP kinase [Oscillospiraceae bacterium]
MTKFSVAIDGPAGAGKSTIAKAAAQMLGFVYVDTGAIYRTVGLAARERGYAADAHDLVVAMLPELDIDMRYVDGVQRMFLDGKDVSEEIRTPEASHYASNVAAMAEVRTYLMEMQRSMARRYDVLMDGRDIGTVVLPDAQLKIFLTASAEERARRRYAQLCEKGTDETYESVLAEIIERDKRDSEREAAPLKQAEDAVLLDTSHMTPKESILAVVELVEKKRKAGTDT